MKQDIKWATNKQWSLRPKNKIDIEALMKLHSIRRVTASILGNRNIGINESDAFFNRKIKSHMPDPSLLHNMDEATDIIYSHTFNNKKIAILGDYDVDGITSTALLYSYLTDIEANVEYFIPDRYSQGYGLSEAALYELNKKISPDLLILLDNGSVSHKEIEIAKKEYGMKVVVIDHHAVDPYKSLPADAFVNPNKIEDTTDTNYLCTVGLTHLLFVSLNRKCRKNNKKTVNPLSYIDLVALGTVCDMVPLKSLNRAYVFSGIELINKKYSIGLSALLKETKVFESVSYETLGYQIGPVINAASRMGNRDVAISLLTCKSPEKCIELSKRLVDINISRKEEEEKIINATLQQINLDSNFIFHGSSNYISGIVGIIAGRVKEMYNKPTCIYALNEDTGIATVSARSIEKIDLGNIVLSAKQKGLIIKGGGHKAAAGFSFEISNLENVVSFFNTEYDKQIKYSKQGQDTNLFYIDYELDENLIDLKLIEEIKVLEPFGQAFPEPSFYMRDVRIASPRQIGKDKNHIAFNLYKGEKVFKAVCFKCLPGPIGEQILDSNTLKDVIVTLNKNYYNGYQSIQIQIKDITI